mmetsp:Transcript_19718/g.31477  ORF Transcript_19718/g.31477 Transcript_19718/m.31477 type:complete len:103 (-) Transcript_19718:143-451(-)
MLSTKGHVDLGCKESLKLLLRPHMHGAIDTWLAETSTTEKRGVIRLARMADPNVLNIDKPRKAGLVPTCCLPKMSKDSSTGSLSYAGHSMMKSASSPAMHGY